MDASSTTSSLSTTITPRAKLPEPSAYAFFRRQQTQYPAIWATCGYFDGDADNPATCGDDGSCFCQTTSGVMGHCFPSGTLSSCEYFTTCSDGTLEGYQITNGGSAANSMTCGGASPHCQYLTWTNSRQSDRPTWSAWQCGAERTTLELSWANGTPTRTSTSTSSTSTSASTTSSTSTSTPTADTSNDSSLSGGAIGGIAAGGVVVAAVLIAIVIWILHHRKTKAENKKRLTSMEDTNFKRNSINGQSSLLTPFLKPVEKDGTTSNASSTLFDGSQGHRPSESYGQELPGDQSWHRMSGMSELPGSPVQNQTNRNTLASELSGSTGSEPRR